MHNNRNFIPNEDESSVDDSDKDSDYDPTKNNASESSDSEYRIDCSDEEVLQVPIMSNNDATLGNASKRDIVNERGNSENVIPCDNNEDPHSPIMSNCHPTLANVTEKCNIPIASNNANEIVYADKSEESPFSVISNLKLPLNLHRFESLLPKYQKPQYEQACTQIASCSSEGRNTLRYFCAFCHKDVAQLPRHLQSTHPNEILVKRAMELPKGKYWVLTFFGFFRL